MVLSWVKNVYDGFVEEVSVTDPRTKDLLLMQSIIPVLIIISIYLWFCLKWGPKFMENRKAFELKNTLIVYNAVSVVVSIWMTYEALASGWWNDYSFRCQLVDYSDNPKATRMARLIHLYFICKLVELLDTIFFVLRKKNNQVTLLHLYHHSVMPIYTYIAVKTVPGGSTTFGLLLNCFVHSVMYTYYLLAGLGPQYQKYLWWKAHLTKLQLIQFQAILVQQLVVYFSDCPFPRTIPLLQITNLILVSFLFLSFYKSAYTKPTSKTAATIGAKKIA